MKHLRMIRDILIILFGNLLYAMGVVLFILPSGLITGGSTGIAMSIHYYMGIPVAGFVFIFNLVMFLLGLFALGKKFALSTLVSSLSYPIFLGILQKISNHFILTQDIMLCTLFGGICIGASIALVIRAGASTGGMDIPPLILQRYFGIPVSVSLYAADCVILAMQAAFRDREKILYGILLVFAYSIILDKLLMFGTNKMQLKIISQKSPQIKEAILLEIDRGVTLLHAKTGYLEQETDIILSVVSTRELYKVEKIIHSIDEDAFVMISRVSEVRGKGFSLGKEYVKKNS